MVLWHSLLLLKPSMSNPSSLSLTLTTLSVCENVSVKCIASWQRLSPTISCHFEVGWEWNVPKGIIFLTDKFAPKLREPCCQQTITVVDSIILSFCLAKAYLRSRKRNYTNRCMFTFLIHKTKLKCCFFRNISFSEYFHVNNNLRGHHITKFVI